jgi:LCP family protein required for cell wall assembly
VVPTSVPLLPIGEDILVFALLGTDEERTPGSWRTDAIVLAFVDPGARRVGLLSIPRDLWVYIPGYGHERINTVDIMGGLALLDQTFRYNLGVPVHHYVRVNFSGFARIVDAVGGVTVNVEQALEDKIPDPLSPTGWFEIALEEGSQHLDGQTALAYCRSRITTSDFDRSRRQRQVLLALWQQTFTVDALGQVPELWAVLGESFDTDLSVGAGIQLAQAMVGLDVENVRSASLNAAVEQWTTPDGAWVLLPHPDAVRQAILDLLSSSA